MIIEELHIVNFKSIVAADCRFSPKVNCLVGNNGMGKTNLLDALHFLSFCRSHLSVPDNMVVKHGEEMALLQGLYRDESGDAVELLLSIRPGKHKVLRRNKKEYERLSDHIGRFPLVIVSPQDYQLILGGSDERRRFMDQQLCQQDPRYLSALIQYNRHLQQRNTMLKQDRHDDALMDVLELQMESYAAEIYKKRRCFVEDFLPVFNDLYSDISGSAEEVSLSYRSHLADGVPLGELLRRSRPKDYLLGFSSCGVHKDELEMLLGGVLIRKIGSEGQNKTFLISMKLAQFRHQQLHGHETPILLLDDIFDKLDATRVERIIRLVGGNGFGQIFITDTNRKYLDEIIASWSEDYRLFKIENGQIFQQ